MEWALAPFPLRRILAKFCQRDSELRQLTSNEDLPKDVGEGPSPVELAFADWWISRIVQLRP